MRRLALMIGFVGALASTSAHAQCAAKFGNQLYGIYRSDDGGTFHVRQIGNDVWWSGDAADGKKNVFHGQISGNVLKGQWLDVPAGQGDFPTNAGEVSIQFSSDHERMTKLPSPTGPHSSQWHRVFICHDTN